MSVFNCDDDRKEGDVGILNYSAYEHRVLDICK